MSEKAEVVLTQNVLLPLIGTWAGNLICATTWYNVI